MDIWGVSSDDLFIASESFKYPQSSIHHYNGSGWSHMWVSGNGSKAVWGAASDDVFEGGDGVHHYSGGGWSQMMIKPYGVYGIWGTASDDVFAVGYNGTIWHYNGSSWSQMSSGIPHWNWLYGVWGAASDDVFAVGGDGTILHYNGSAWNKMYSDSDLEFYGVWGSAPDDVYAVGMDWPGDNIGVMWHYNGNTWDEIINLAGIYDSSELRGVWGSSASDVYAVGYAVENSVPYEGRGIIWHYNGSSWSDTGTGAPNSTLHAVWGLSATDVYAVGEYGNILHYSYDADPWDPNDPVELYNADRDDIEAAVADFMAQPTNVSCNHTVGDVPLIDPTMFTFITGCTNVSGKRVLCNQSYYTIAMCPLTTNASPEGILDEVPLSVHSSNCADAGANAERKCADLYCVGRSQADCGHYAWYTTANGSIISVCMGADCANGPYVPNSSAMDGYQGVYP
jgi:hypothetical protein